MNETINLDFNQALCDVAYHDAQPKVTFGPYAPTYLIATSEDVDYDIKRYMYNCKTNKYCEKVLTVAASGDHPLFCKRYGAKDITTFDITYTAKLIMDIKTIAIRQLKFKQYWQLLTDLWHNKNISRIPNMKRIIPQLDATEQEYIRVMDGKFSLFEFGVQPGIYDTDKVRHEALHTELHKCQGLSKFPFIWSDIAQLDAKLADNTYDFIHLSNILDYVSNDTKTSVLNSMVKRLNCGGRILIKRIKENYVLDDLCEDIAMESFDLSHHSYIDKHVLVKTR